MVLQSSGRNPFKNSRNQKIPALPSPFIRKGDPDVESICFTSNIPKAELFPSNPDYSLSGTLDTQSWVTSWINSTGDNMSYSQAMYHSDPHGSGWKREIYDEEQHSVNLSSAGQEFFDFQSSSSDAGHQALSNGQVFPNVLPGTPVSGESLPGPFLGYQEETIPNGYYGQTQMMVSRPEMMDNTRIANGAMTRDEFSTSEAASTFPGLDHGGDSPSTDSPTDEHADMHGISNASYSQVPYGPQTTQPMDFALDMLDAISLDAASSWDHSGAVVFSQDSVHANLGYAATGMSSMSSAQTSIQSNQDTDPERRRSKPLLPRPPRSASDPSEAFNEDDSSYKEETTKSRKNSSPRSHDLYKKGPDADGMYRCPFIKDEQCQHIPTRQKCTYDKYVDAHLKPYRCKKEGCRELPFSSNAVLGRHEREAHGMHGHGIGPYRCIWNGCRRSQSDAGFPRRWNAKDHMRRVHQVEVSDEDLELGYFKNGPEMLSISSNMPVEVEQPIKKRRNTNSRSVPMKKTASSQSRRSTKSITADSRIRRRQSDSIQNVQDYSTYYGEPEGAAFPSGYLNSY